MGIRALTALHLQRPLRAQDPHAGHVLGVGDAQLEEAERGAVEQRVRPHRLLELHQGLDSELLAEGSQRMDSSLNAALICSTEASRLSCRIP